MFPLGRDNKARTKRRRRDNVNKRLVGGVRKGKRRRRGGEGGGKGGGGGGERGGEGEGEGVGSAKWVGGGEGEDDVVFTKTIFSGISESWGS